MGKGKRMVDRTRNVKDNTGNAKEAYRTNTRVPIQRGLAISLVASCYFHVTFSDPVEEL